MTTGIMAPLPLGSGTLSGSNASFASVFGTSFDFVGSYRSPVSLTYTALRLKGRK